ncbi:VanZ family protein [Chitinophaga sp. GCM10012297]|uniref:VanZ family protein n=1 Tax=Chitinophaga chungangae TaxID=2821488 RepID=A0ABS3YD55_9BACT|nr:VanZ family protein [Chitinophaga chungangae]MBO9152617.1 VanZ family protein [Chitinophaga chungangae]
MGWVILILFLCTLPGEAIPQVSAFDMLHIDKVVHFVLFGGTVLLLAYGIHKQKGNVSKWALFWMVAAASLYGLAIEFIQKYLVIHRSFDLYDFLADSLGAASGALVYWWIGRRILK